MKRLILALALILAPSMVMAKSAVVSWIFDAADDDIAGFALYREQEKIASIDDPAARTYTGDIVNHYAAACYTMTAVDKGGNESPHSPCFNFDPPPDMPGNVRVMVVVDVTVAPAK